MTTTMRLNARAIAFTVMAGVLLLGLLAALGVWAVTRDSRKDLSLAEIAKTASQNNGYASEALTGLRDDTATLCDNLPGCIEGYSSDRIDLVRFASKDRAAAFAAVRAGSHQSDWIVIEYRDGVSDRGRREVETYLDTLWSSE